MRQRQSVAVSPSAESGKTENPVPSKLGPQQKEASQLGVLGSSKKVFAPCLAFQIANALLIQTYFNPDEHWQALEVAHRITFGYLHPFLFAFLYKAIAMMGLDTPWFMSYFAGFGDLYLYKLSVIIFGDCVAKWALFSQLTNRFMFYCITRTFSNSLETVLTLVSLYYWPCIRPSSSKLSLESRKWGLIIASLACAIRPTIAIIWLYVGLLELFLTRDKLRFIFLESMHSCQLCVALHNCIDIIIVLFTFFVPLNFLRFNFLSAGGDYYGTHKWYWYFTQGFTVMIFSFLPFSVAEIMQSKHWEFVLPVLPIALMFSGHSLAALRTSVSENGKGKEPLNINNKCPAKMQLAIFFLLATNIPMALYMSLVHQTERNRGCYILLMPCHATPYYSTVHRNLLMRFLDCSPSEEKGILDESDQFMMDPVGFTSELARNWSLSSHIVLFDSEEKQLRDFLISHSFREIKRFFHAHFKVDRDLQVSVIVYGLTGD
ncbi:GPI mannosyltransferase 3-like [Pyrus ussuriensis x Pyrus communis]|uniref:Mannosyltransferase n=1 Tax=Pyrus ussuriensis x Pyrus communis TaxID=2448454 RepID=A0A5N5FPP2_9ROSA|nr:GPI mannosyltransferase 3-like [Pyrus ussuriensis x Pyrus communis]